MYETTITQIRALVMLAAVDAAERVCEVFFGGLGQAARCGGLTVTNPCFKTGTLPFVFANIAYHTVMMACRPVGVHRAVHLAPVSVMSGPFG